MNPETKTAVNQHKVGMKKTLKAVGVLVLVLAAYALGASSKAPVDLKDLGINIVNQEPSDPNLTNVDYDLLWKTLRVVNTQYVDKPVDQKQLMYGAVHGLVRALNDPHSEFLAPAENEKFMDDLAGNFEGIGAELGVRDGKLTVIAPLPNTPAERAGLRPQDLIIEIDGEPSLDWTLDKAVNKIRGEKGSTVTLTVLHKDANEPQELKITRDTIRVESVTSEVKTVNGRRIAYIKVARFGPDTKAAFTDAVSRVTPNTQGLVLDLRNNPGGLLETSIDLSSFWLKGNQVTLKEVDADKQESSYLAKGPGNLANTKTVVLINEGSASASEIVAGALQDHRLATLVGQKSYGKGSVQDLVDLGGGAAVKITIAKWLTPNGRSIHEQGIEPDVKVEMTNEDIDASRDPQLDRALELASQR